MERGRQSGGWFGFGSRNGGPADQSVLSEGDRDAGADLEDDDMGDALNQLRYATLFHSSAPLPSPRFASASVPPSVTAAVFLESRPTTASRCEGADAARLAASQFHRGSVHCPRPTLRPLLTDLRLPVGQRSSFSHVAAACVWGRPWGLHYHEKM